jgi:hypothetical protein
MNFTCYTLTLIRSLLHCDCNLTTLLYCCCSNSWECKQAKSEKKAPTRCIKVKTFWEKHKIRALPPTVPNIVTHPSNHNRSTTHLSICNCVVADRRPRQRRYSRFQLIKAADFLFHHFECGRRVLVRRQKRLVF